MRRQSSEFAIAAKKYGFNVTNLEDEGCDHFSVLEKMTADWENRIPMYNEVFFSDSNIIDMSGCLSDSIPMHD